MNRVERIKYRGSDIFLAGIVISRTPMGNLHVGIGHRVPAGPLHILHLAWDCMLEDDLDGHNDAFPSPLYVIPDIDPEDEEVLSGLCRRIFETTSNHKIRSATDHGSRPRKLLVQDSSRAKTGRRPARPAGRTAI
jgi:hypothetical protein